MEKYVIVSFINSSEIPNTFPSSEWPLHLTLLRNFTIKSPLENLLEELDKCSKNIKAFNMLVENESVFGSNKNIPVSVLQVNKNVTELHADLVTIADKLGAVYDDPQFVGEGYKPHVTVQGENKLNVGQNILVDNIALASFVKRPEGKMVKIIRTFYSKGDSVDM